MSSPLSVTEPGLDTALRALVATHGYEMVSQHLLRLAPALQNTPNAASLMAMPAEPPEQSLPVAKAQALFAYEADTKRPSSNYPSSADPAGGDFHEYV